MATESNVRVSDAERENVAAQLREHYAQGRLTLDELNERLDRVFASKTRTDLSAVTSDLPYAAPHGVLPSDGVRYGSGPGGGQGAWGGPRWNGPGRDGSGSYYRGGRSRGSFLQIIPVLLAVWACVALIGVFGFGLGSGPSVLVIIFGALAVLRRIFRFGRGRGPVRGGRRGGCGRR
jgi:Domain of unknown function (DUF1707)